jgi:hypothetical protein
MSTALLLDAQDDTVLRACVQRAIERAALKPLSWNAGQTVAARPALIVTVLRSGDRRLPPELATLAEERFADVPVVAVSPEALAQTVIQLADGRLTLVGAPVESDRLAEHLEIARRWLPAIPVVRREWRVGAAQAWRVGPTARVRDMPDGVGAVLAADDGETLERTLAAELAACRDDAAGERLVGRLSPGQTAVGGGWWAQAHLRDDARRWVLASGADDGEAVTVALISAGRAPRWWLLPTGAVRVLDAHPGDVALIGHLPADPVFGAIALRDAALAGGSVLAAHLDHHATRLGLAVDAVVLEVR